MTRQKLKQLRHLKREIELLEEQILCLDAEVVTDKVRGSLSHHPWIETSFKITGFDREELGQKMERLKKKMQRRVDDLLELRTEILEFVENIDDSLLRQVIILRHVNGLSWEQVAAEIGSGTTWNSLRMMHDRFLERL
jgi:DNA-directed RNA polymerase specialized sigma24 family protein